MILLISRRPSQVMVSDGNLRIFAMVSTGVQQKVEGLHVLCVGREGSSWSRYVCLYSSYSSSIDKYPAA